MTHFSPDPPSDDVKMHLEHLKQSVLAETGQKAQYIKAKDLWGDRKNKNENKAKWQQIEANLSQNHPIAGICQYCEFDRTAATEHFFPVKYFPGKAFDWNNYLLVCYRCNSTYKKDQFAVFNPKGSSIVHHLPITRGTYHIPPTEDAVLINPRIEHPQDYLMIDLVTGIFLPVSGVDARGKEKAVYTRHRKRKAGSLFEKVYSCKMPT